MDISLTKKEVLKMTRIIHDNKHLSLNDRKIIEQGIENRCNKVNIARTLEKTQLLLQKK